MIRIAPAIMGKVLHLHRIRPVWGAQRSFRAPCNHKGICKSLASGLCYTFSFFFGLSDSSSLNTLGHVTMIEVEQWREYQNRLCLINSWYSPILIRIKHVILLLFFIIWSLGTHISWISIKRWRSLIIYPLKFKKKHLRAQIIYRRII